MKVHIDRDKCVGHGRCYSLVPDLFEPDDYGDGHVIGDGQVPEGMESEAELAVANCPEQAISIVTDTEGEG